MKEATLASSSMTRIRMRRNYNRKGNAAGGAERDPGGAEDGAPESPGLRRRNGPEHVWAARWQDPLQGNGCPGGSVTGPAPSRLVAFSDRYRAARRPR